MWYELGRFELDADAENYVLARATDEKYCIADAICVQKAWYNEAVNYHAEVKSIISSNLPLCFPEDKIGELNVAHSALGNVLVEETADKATVKAAMDAVNDILELRKHSFETDIENSLLVCTVCGHSEKLGDIDGDGSVTVKDTLDIIRTVVNNTTIENGDVNGDGKVSLVDVIRIMKLIAQ